MWHLRALSRRAESQMRVAQSGRCGSLSAAAPFLHRLRLRSMSSVSSSRATRHREASVCIPWSTSHAGAHQIEVMLAALLDSG